MQENERHAVSRAYTVFPILIIDNDLHEACPVLKDIPLITCFRIEAFEVQVFSYLRQAGIKVSILH